MRLFAVRLPNRELLVSTTNGLPVWFDDKMQAKKVRDQHPGSVVVLGPDHDRYRYHGE
jgi:hypothetical protein